MPREAAQFAAVLDRIAYDALAQLENISENALICPFPLPGGTSLYGLALSIVETGEIWVQGIVGRQSLSSAVWTLESTEQLLPDLIDYYNQWLSDMHQVLDSFPDALLECIVQLPTVYRKELGDGPISVRDCLLHTVELTACTLGNMQTIHRLLIASQRTFEEFSEEDEGL